MNISFSNRIYNVPRSFIREILKIANKKDVISFAGGLPNPNLFPIKNLAEVTQHVFLKYQSAALQYSNSEGSEDLRKHIAHYYKHKGIDVNIEEILITNGSQQALDLLGKIFINEGDQIIIEEPGYLGAIQAFSMYKPEYIPIPLNEDGLDCNTLEDRLKNNKPKLAYVVPNFQNPSGISYSEENRKSIAAIFEQSKTFIIEDDPYGEIRFNNSKKQSFKTLLPNQTIMLGTFSKIVVPSFRIGWIVAQKEIMKKLIIAKQAADLHTNYFCQLVLFEYFKMFDNSQHIKKISVAYEKQCRAMINAMEKYFPKNVKYTKPEGGMFLWVTLPEGITAKDLLEICTKEKVIFVPGDQFYTNRKEAVSTLRLNFSCSDENTIDQGIRLIGNAIKGLI
jgi:2-aminoadipate transaminase